MPYCRYTRYIFERGVGNSKAVDLCRQPAVGRFPERSCSATSALVGDMIAKDIPARNDCALVSLRRFVRGYVGTVVEATRPGRRRPVAELRSLRRIFCGEGGMFEVRRRQLAGAGRRSRGAASGHSATYRGQAAQLQCTSPGELEAGRCEVVTVCRHRAPQSTSTLADIELYCGLS